METLKNQNTILKKDLINKTFYNQESLLYYINIIQIIKKDNIIYTKLIFIINNMYAFFFIFVCIYISLQNTLLFSFMITFIYA